MLFFEHYKSNLQVTCYYVSLIQPKKIYIGFSSIDSRLHRKSSLTNNIRPPLGQLRSNLYGALNPL